MTVAIHDAAIALSNILDRLDRIHAAAVLFDVVRSNGDEAIKVNSSTLIDFAAAGLEESVRGIFDECDTVQEFLNTLDGVDLDELMKANAGSQLG
ncbi:MAG: hypothetical protein N0C81_10085 [Candidatus Thiodiazotropha lotti]|nr:hypothetical protein [Candidatus Thiodiazotropha lotti]MCW4195567.1 hypothetical protein [Candidatus Thiodiazotropha lotti]